MSSLHGTLVRVFLMAMNKKMRLSFSATAAGDVSFVWVVVFFLCAVILSHVSGRLCGFFLESRSPAAYPLEEGSAQVQEKKQERSPVPQASELRLAVGPPHSSVLLVPTVL